MLIDQSFVFLNNNFFVAAFILVEEGYLRCRLFNTAHFVSPLVSLKKIDIQDDCQMSNILIEMVHRRYLMCLIPVFHQCTEKFCLCVVWNGRQNCPPMPILTEAI